MYLYEARQAAWRFLSFNENCILPSTPVFLSIDVRSGVMIIAVATKSFTIGLLILTSIGFTYTALNIAIYHKTTITPSQNHTTVSHSPCEVLHSVMRSNLHKDPTYPR